MRPKSIAPRALLLVLLPMLTACGSGEARVPVHPVSGQVLFNGKPAAGARIVLHPVDAKKAPAGVVAAGTVKKDGAFELGVYDVNDGAPAGEYVATIELRKVVAVASDIAGRGENILPRDYSTPRLSPIRVTVKEGANAIPPIRIARR